MAAASSPVRRLSRPWIIGVTGFFRAWRAMGSPLVSRGAASPRSSRQIEMAVVVEVAHIAHLFSETSRHQPFRSERPVPTIWKDRERPELVDLIAGGDDLGSAVAVEIAHQQGLDRG